MKDSQQFAEVKGCVSKYIKANNERFSTAGTLLAVDDVSISRRIMKDSQPRKRTYSSATKYIKANNERFSTTPEAPAAAA